jgi:16S rRNA (guanine527-N7)-methyltransferase
VTSSNSSASISDAELLRVLEAGQRNGTLGPQPVAAMLAHALTFVALVPHSARNLVDLGSGGGLPGLVVAARCPWLERCVLIDRRAKRTDHLMRMTRRLGLVDRVEVVTADLDDVVHRPDSPVSFDVATFDVATARSLGTTADTTRWASSLLADEGILLVSEPPKSMAERWAPYPEWADATVIEGVCRLVRAQRST